MLIPGSGQTPKHQSLVLRPILSHQIQKSIRLHRHTYAHEVVGSVILQYAVRIYIYIYIIHIYIHMYCQTHLVCAFWSIMQLRRPRMFRHMPLPFLSHSGGRERSHGGCGTKQQSRVFAGALESNLKGLRFTLVAEPLRRRPVRVFFQSWNRNGFPQVDQFTLVHLICFAGEKPHFCLVIASQPTSGCEPEVQPCLDSRKVLQRRQRLRPMRGRIPSGQFCLLLILPVMILGNMWTRSSFCTAFVQLVTNQCLDLAGYADERNSLGSNQSSRYGQNWLIRTLASRYFCQQWQLGRSQQSCRLMRNLRKLCIA